LCRASWFDNACSDLLPYIYFEIHCDIPIPGRRKTFPPYLPTTLPPTLRPTFTIKRTVPFTCPQRSMRRQDPTFSRSPFCSIPLDLARIFDHDECIGCCENASDRELCYCPPLSYSRYSRPILRRNGQLLGKILLRPMIVLSLQRFAWIIDAIWWHYGVANTLCMTCMALRVLLSGDGHVELLPVIYYGRHGAHARANCPLC
jgi:hypothetical protein